MIIKLAKAILKINPNAKFTIQDNNVNQITWENGTTPISKSEIEAMIPVVEAEIAQAELDKKQAEQSAIDKLKALGLTDAEVEAFRK